MVGGGPFGLEPGQWTDDTSLALCLAESLVKCREFNAIDQMKRFVRWWKYGHLSSTSRCFDIGNTTRTALAEFERTGNPFSGPTDPQSAGDGSIMRLAPVPMFFANRSTEAMEMAGESSRTTHGAVTAVDACRYLAALIVGALQGVDKNTLTTPTYAPVPGYWDERPLTPEIDEICSGSFREREPPEIRGSRCVVKLLEAALWAFHGSSSFREGCLLAVNLGDHADTIGAVYGQLAGAYYGEPGIPGEWLAKLSRRELIVSFADKLFEAQQ